MLIKKAEEYQNQPPIFENDDPNIDVQEVNLSTYNREGIDTKQISIRFINKKAAKAFCEEFPEVCPIKYPASYRTTQPQNTLPNTNKIHPAYLKYSYTNQGPFEVSIILSEQISKDLEKIYNFLSQHMSEANLDIIKAYTQPRSLSCLEQNFYKKLNDLTSENLDELFNDLLKDAKEIAEKERGIQVNAIWALAMRCKDIEKFEDKPKFVEALNSIDDNDNYYKKAQKEFVGLSYGWITILKDSPNKRDLLAKIITSTTLFIKKDPDLLNLLKQAILSYSGKYDLIDSARQQASEAIDKAFGILMESRKGSVGNLITKLIDLYETEAEKFKSPQQNSLTQTEEQPEQRALIFSQTEFTKQQIIEIQEHCSTLTSSISSSSTDEPSPKKTKLEPKFS